MIKNKIITICAVLLSLIQPLPSVSNGITANNISSSKSTTIQSPKEGASSKEHNTAYDDESDVLDIKKTSIMYKKFLNASTDSTGSYDSQLIILPQYSYDEKTMHTVLTLNLSSNDGSESNNDVLQKMKSLSQKHESKYDMIGYATIMFDDEEEFTCLMMYAYKEDAKIPYHAIYLILSQTQESNRIDEINDDTWNIWSKLKYVNSRLTKKNISFITLSDINKNYIGYIGLDSSTKECMYSILHKLGDNLGSHEIYKYNWE